MKVEITKDIQLDKKHFNKMLFHSVLNTLNVVIGSLNHFRHLNSSQSFSDSITMLDKIINSIISGEDKKPKPIQTSLLKSLVLNEIENLKQQPLNDEASSMLQFIENNINAIFTVLKKRTNELNLWGGTLTYWDYFQTDEITEDIIEFFNVQVASSSRNYKINFVPHEMDKDTYFIDIDINGDRENNLLMPSFLLNVILDLSANARRYTQTPGTIGIELFPTREYIELIISDTGMGISEEDLQKVIEFGVQGKHERTAISEVGGYGLSKAYYITKQNNGRFWIESEVGKGTTITIQIPNI